MVNFFWWTWNSLQMWGLLQYWRVGMMQALRKPEGTVYRGSTLKSFQKEPHSFLGHSPSGSWCHCHKACRDPVRLFCPCPSQTHTLACPVSHLPLQSVTPSASTPAATHQGTGDSNVFLYGDLMGSLLFKWTGLGNRQIHSNVEGNWAIKATMPTVHPQVSPAAGLLCLHRVGVIYSDNPCRWFSRSEKR